MREFLKDAVDTPLELARTLGLTLADHSQHTDDVRMMRHPDNVGRENEPNRVLGMMCLKVLGHDDPCTKTGKRYPLADVEYFWARLALLADGRLPEKFAKAVRRQVPSKSLQQFVSSLVGRGRVFVLTGRLRADAGYTARRNTVFQGLTSDGAKLALWWVWRKGYRIVNFIHDEILVEVPASDDLTLHANKVERLMVAAMKEVLPDVRVEVKYAATDRWRKGAEAVFDDEERLVLWHPEGERSTHHRRKKKVERKE